MASGNLAAAAAFFSAMGARTEHARHAGVARAAKLIEDKAKAVIGTYDYGWPELDDATKEDRVRQGFTANEPELRSGALKASIGHVAEGDHAVIGSADKNAVFAELGTSRAPPRPIFGPSVLLNLDEIKKEIGAPFHAALVGRSIRDD